MFLTRVPSRWKSIYKQVKLRTHGDLHPIFLIGWIGVFQFLFTLVSAPGLGWAAGLPLGELPKNIWNGLKCYFGSGSIESGCHPDSPCKHAFIFVNLCFFCQALYMMCTMLVLKYGSTSLLYLAMTMMVPLGNLTFLLRMDSSICLSDVAALTVIVLGLLLYRFGTRLPIVAMRTDHERLHTEGAEVQEPDPESRRPMLEPLISYAYV